MIPHPSGDAAVLKPCPFCGGPAEEMAGLVGCLPCACGRRNADSWNRRADPVREELEQAPPQTASHPSRPASKKRDLWQVMQDLYDSEINCGCQSFWDGGFRIWLGDDINGREAEGDGNFLDEHFDEAGDWLHEAAMQLYSTSDYAKRYRQMQNEMGASGAEGDQAIPSSDHPRTGSPKESA